MQDRLAIALEFTNALVRKEGEVAVEDQATEHWMNDMERLT
jgi:hypothetical protein